MCRSRGGWTVATFRDMANRRSHVLVDHGDIQRWAEARGARPVSVRGTGSARDIGIIRLDLPGYVGEEKLRPVSWDQWFDKFEETNLALVVEETTTRGQQSNFNKLISRESVNLDTGRLVQAPRSRRKAAARTGAAALAGTTAARTTTTARRRTTAAKKPTARKTTARTTTARSRTTAAKKPTARKTTARKPTATRAKTTAAARKKTTGRRTAAKTARSRTTTGPGRTSRTGGARNVKRPEVNRPGHAFPKPITLAGSRWTGFPSGVVYR